MVESFKESMATLSLKLEALEDAYANYYLAEDSEYNVAMKNYIYAKDSLLSKRLELAEDGELSEADKTILADYETAVANVK